MANNVVGFPEAKPTIAFYERAVIGKNRQYEIIASIKGLVSGTIVNVTIAYSKASSEDQKKLEKIHILDRDEPFISYIGEDSKNLTEQGDKDIAHLNYQDFKEKYHLSKARVETIKYRVTGEISKENVNKAFVKNIRHRINCLFPLLQKILG